MVDEPFFPCYNASKIYQKGGQTDGYYLLRGKAQKHTEIYYKGIRMKKKNVFVVLFALAMVMAGSLLCGNAAPQIDHDSASSVAETAAVASANVKQLEGAGTVNDPYLIYNEEDLNDIRNYATYQPGPRNYAIYGIFEIKRTINLTQKWIPIEYPFYGTLEGNYYSINEMTIDIYGAGNYGLFESNYGFIQNLTISGLEIGAISAAYGSLINFGAFAGINYATISECELHNSSIILNSYYGSSLGGITGQSFSGGYISNCTVSSTCSLISSGWLGGITAYVKQSTVIGCKNQATVEYRKASNSCPVGGIAGGVQIFGKVMNCVNSGTIRTTEAGGEIGGIFGRWDQSGSIINNTQEGTIQYNVS